MGAKALTEVGKCFYKVLGQAHNIDATQDKAPTKQGPIIQEVFILGRSLAASAMAREAWFNIR